MENEQGQMSTISRKTGRFWDLTFKFGSIISGICVIVFFLVFAITLLGYLFGGAPGFKVPKFKDYQSTYDGTTSTGTASDFSATDKRLKVEQKYSDDIKEIAKKYAFNENGYKVILNNLVDLPEDLRSDFISGAYKFVDSGLEYAKSNKKENEISSADLYNNYKNIFYSNVEDWNLGKSLAQANKYQKIGTIAGSLLLFIVFLIIPLLIKIEENTRR